jgi:hypothetical protein
MAFNFIASISLSIGAQRAVGAASIAEDTRSADGASQVVSKKDGLKQRKRFM